MDINGLEETFDKMRLTHDCFQFLDLPPELREMVYGHYFNDSSVILGPKGQPRTKHADGLLWVSRQVHLEALPIFYKEATFTLNLARKYGPQPERDFVYMLDHHVKYEDFIAARKATIRQFRKV